MAAPADRAARYDAVQSAFVAGIMSCTLEFTVTDDRDLIVDEARVYFDETHARPVGLGVSGESDWLLTIFGG